ncbi:MAG: hypothetical protein U0324_22705 [Polyangiales bacterium]
MTVRIALARPGVPGGAARSFVTIAGTVTGVPAGMTLMRFTFRRQVAGDAGLVEVACERMVTTPVGAAGDFAAEVPLEPFTAQCPEAMFDGTDVSVDVAVNGVPVVDGGAVNPVPYAIHADTAALASAAAPDSGLERRLVEARTIDPGRVIVNGTTPQDGGFSVSGNASVGGTISGHGADLLVYAGACLATGRAGRFIVEGTVAESTVSCATICASRSGGPGCGATCVVGWTIAPNGDHYGYNDNECTVTGPVLAGGHRVCCCAMPCFVPTQVR